MQALVSYNCNHVIIQAKLLLQKVKKFILFILSTILVNNSK
jgi:hypothetical protein